MKNRSFPPIKIWLVSFSKLKYKVSNFSGKDYNFNTTKHSYNCDNVSAQRNLKNSHSMCCWSNFWSPLISDQLRLSPTIGPYFPIGPTLNLLQLFFLLFFCHKEGNSVPILLSFFFAKSNPIIDYERPEVYIFEKRWEVIM